MIHILYADTGSDSLGILFQRIGKSLERIRRGESDAKRVILVVPAQFTLGAEEAAFRYLGGEGFFDLHIMSNNKLAKEILRETGGMGRTPVNSLGRAMMLRKIAKDNADAFDLFGKVACDGAFLDMAGDFVLQLKQNNIDSAALEALSGTLRGESILRRKLNDMLIFCREYEALTSGTYNDAEDLRAFVTQRVKDCRYVRDSEIFFYDFYSFTARDLDSLAELAAWSHGLTVQLLMNETDDAFEASRRTLRQLKAAAAKRNLPFLAENVVLPRGAIETERHVVRCASPFTQAETIAAEILTLVRDRGIRYGEIAVLTGDPEGQGQTIRRVLELAGIPVFSDEKRGVSHDPAVELLSALLSLAEEGFRQQTVLRILKTGLTDFADDEQTEYFENYVKQYHINGDRFTVPFRYGAEQCGAERFAMLESVRGRLADSLGGFAEAFDAAVSAEEKTKVLRRYAENELHVRETLEEKASALAGAGLLDASEELAQIWDLLTGLLDQLCELLGGVGLSNAEYREIIESSIADVRVGLLPQAEGKVLLGTVTRSRIANVRALFIAGFNDGLIPRGAFPEGILTEQELLQLEGQGCVLSKSCEYLIEEERLVLRKVLDTPAEYLWTGYPVSDAEGAEIKPSGSLTEYRIRFSLPEEPDIENREDVLGFVQNQSSSLRYLTQALRSAFAGEDLADSWKAAYNVLKGKGEPRLAAVREGLFFDPGQQPIGSGSAAALYGFGTSPACSPSRIESFAGCPFRHFVSYGLRPDEQREFDLGAIELGTIYHEVLRSFCERLSAPCRAAHISFCDPASLWMTVTEEEIEAQIGAILEGLADDALEGLLSRGKAERYRMDRIRKVCVRFASQMVRQVRTGNVSDMLVETSFGAGRRFPAVEIPCSGGRIRLEGKIDRVDLLKIGGQEYVKIIDYKSGSRSFDREAAVKGLAVQLMVYMEGALQAHPEAKPAGVFYCLIKETDAPVRLDDIDTEHVASEITESFAKDYRLNGLLVGERSIVQDIDPGALTAEGGTVLPVKTDKEGMLKASGGTEIVDGDGFDALRSDVLHAVRELCEKLTSGDISVAPQRLPGSSGDLPCRYCDYRGICLYDN